ncbi:MAG: penicillin-binding protein 1B [Gammaproteobacteria bacterium]|nr:penicillin-binding protein 1B [Gammaproteobacteria bacterium]MDH5800150.1 penicillin-binding protein 1B [Gammaproteobacteria bacterium]
MLNLLREHKRKILILFGLSFVVGVMYVAYLDFQIRTQFEGKRWAIPAKVYARPLELYPKVSLNADQFETELKVLAYRPSMNPDAPGSYFRNGNHFRVITRAFTFWDGSEPSLPLRLNFGRNQLESLYNANSGLDLPIARLDPGIIGRIYPSHTEDRVLLKREELPDVLVQTLIAVEDRDFYSHLGISPKGIARALWANIRAGATVQGGSTLTQQLVKNFFLSSERSLVRKINEAIMSLLLEIHYDKDEILEAYANEIFLGQDGRRSIHGFGLASYFYFEKPLHLLRPDQLALMVAMVKGPSYYSPRRQEKRALARRDLVLDLMMQRGIIGADTAEEAKEFPLDVVSLAKSNITSYPAFMDLVRRQLRRDYKETDLNSEGLQIFTTLDPLIQFETEKALSHRTEILGKWKDLPGSRLQAASVIVSVDGGEVLAVVGGRNPQFAGFNRALDAVRPIGSLVKPAVFLTALSQSQKYNPGTLLDDGPMKLDMGGGTYWEPQNFDKKTHGWVPVYQALSHSYNLSTARLGLDLGIPNIIKTMNKMGVQRDLPNYPSLLLGAAALSPIEVVQMYHTLASGGFRTPVRAIREVLTAKGNPLQRYPWSVEKVLEPQPVYLLNSIMQYTTRAGTGRAVYKYVRESVSIASKTGTSNDLRDSWFVGFTGDKLGVVWMGMDDNQPAGLTGSQGALRVWADIFKSINTESPIHTVPENVEYISGGCGHTVRLPFIKDTVNEEFTDCDRVKETRDQETLAASQQQEQQ